MIHANMTCTECGWRTTLPLDGDVRIREFGPRVCGFIAPCPRCNGRAAGKVAAVPLGPPPARQRETRDLRRIR